MSDWIDISVPLHNGMAHWPGDRPFELTRDADMGAGSDYNLSSFSTSAHAGTHMDAPLHFVAGAPAIDEVPFAAVIGPARVIEVADARWITLAEVQAQGIQAGERILFKTRNSAQPWHDRAFQENFVAIPADTARYLAQVRPKLVGVDYLSVGGYEADGPETHRALLGAGIWVVEGLSLYGVPAGKYELICLPLRMAGSEGAPARALLRRSA